MRRYSRCGRRAAEPAAAPPAEPACAPACAPPPFPSRGDACAVGEYRAWLREDIARRNLWR